MRAMSPKRSSDHPLLVAEFGGAETGPRAAYVEGVGRRVAVHSGIANSQAPITSRR